MTDIDAEREALMSAWPAEAVKRVVELRAALQEIVEARPTEDRGAGWMRRVALLALDNDDTHGGTP